MGDIEARLRALEAEIDKAQRDSLKHGRRNYLVLNMLLVLSVLGSVAAAVLALINAPPLVAGLVALIPAVAVTISTSFKLQAKASWHYGKHTELNGLVRRIRYAVPAAPTAADVAALAQQLTDLDVRMDRQWAETLQVQVSEAAQVNGAR